MSIFLKNRAPIFLGILAVFSCSTSKHVFNAERFRDIAKLTIEKAVKRDINSGYNDISPDHLVLIGEDIYPNVRNFDLGTPRIFEKRIKGFRLTTDYYFTSNDGLVKVILYQWDKVGLGSQKKEFQVQFNHLRESLTKMIGEPEEIEVQQKEFNDETFRDGIKWKGTPNAYLFMFGNDRTEYRQIRLAIYGD